MKFVHNILLYFLPYQNFIAWAKTNSLPGFKKVPLYDVVSFILAEIKKEALFARANAMSFSFFLSLFPSIIVLFTLLAYLPIKNFNKYLQQSFDGILPKNAEGMLFEIIEDITTKQRGGLLSISFALAIFFSSNGMMAMMRAFDKSYKTTFRKRKPFHKRVIAVYLTFLLGILLIGTIILLLAGNYIIKLIVQLLHANIITKLSLFSLKWIGVLFLFYSVISTIYYYGPATRRKFGFLTPGATLATLLCIITSIIFSIFVNQFGTYNKVYGSIGTIIVVMLWIQLNTLNLLIGFELNASIAINRDRRRIKLAEKKEEAERLQKLSPGTT
jgi:membrane protein